MYRGPAVLLATVNDQVGTILRETDAMPGHINRFDDHDGMSLTCQGMCRPYLIDLVSQGRSILHTTSFSTLADMCAASLA